jgi:hypothetical protein
MTFDEVNTRIDQPMEHDIHRGIPNKMEISFAPKHRTKELTEFIISFGGNNIHDTRILKILVHISIERVA